MAVRLNVNFCIKKLSAYTEQEREEETEQLQNIKTF